MSEQMPLRWISRASAELLLRGGHHEEESKCSGEAQRSRQKIHHLEDMEGLKLDGSGVVLKQHHHHLEILAVADVSHHNLHICPVQQQLAQQLHATQLPHKYMKASVLADTVCISLMASALSLETTYSCRSFSKQATCAWQGRAGLMALPYSAVPSFATKMSLRHEQGAEQNTHLERLPSRDIVV